MVDGTGLKDETTKYGIVTEGDFENVPIEDEKVKDTFNMGTTEKIRDERDLVNQAKEDIAENNSTEVLDVVFQIRKDILEQNKITSKISSEIKEIHKLYHNEFVGRLSNMQDELEKYHDIDRGRVYDDILREVARIYCDNEALLGVDADEKIKKRIKFLFMDIEQLLESNGVKIQRSSPGDKRHNKFCQIVERVETTDPEKHDTVVCSKSPGFYTEKRPLIKELIDIYIYQETNEIEE